ncbi:carbohydrate ABC transporter permease [Robertmurraya yapensis]|uniref:Carbohydrate ABC transporter permease n=2 Tax=Bacillaceae TaxID=186817 RepID=A0A3S0IAQ6_9BACI|nr:carbohydrate ABC transporter permease [Bacillus yapensis]RTR29181.1 carbohydrate ABC transporter permease [Bacillus yapensis]TKS94786.1 ABC transporter permease subunit [Bacillus yapensis]
MGKNKTILTIFIFACGLLIILPIFFLVFSSFRTPEDVFKLSLNLSNLTLDNFKAVLETNILRAIWNSLVVSVTVTVVAMLFHAMSGYALARLNFPGKKFVFGWMISTMMVPFTVIMIPLYMVTKNLGLANSYGGLIIPMIFNAYGIFLFRQFYQDFPKELEEAAYVEGLSIAGTFFRLVLPLSKPMIIPLTIGFFTANWNNYLWPLIINQKEELMVVQVALANIVGGGYETAWSIVLAAALLSAIPTFIVFFSMQKYLVDGIKMSGIK